MNKELTREKFTNFLRWLSPEGDRTGEEYEHLRFKLSTFFAQRHCLLSAELADETINRVILKIGEEKIENQFAYCYGVAKNVYRESLRKERSHQRIDEEPMIVKDDTGQSFSKECLEKCLAELSPEDRELILEYFSQVKGAKIESHRNISENIKITQTALRTRVMQIKQKLKVCIQEHIS